jgi:Domain of unknown function (DUF4383)
MVKTLGIIFGILFLVGGVLGFVPGVSQDGMYVGLFMVNAAHNLVHSASGAIFLVASLSGAAAARWWFRIFGVIYAAVAIVGF